MNKLFATVSEQLITVFELLGVVLILTLAFSFQLILKELPCPLCLLQRIGFICITIGFLMNLRFGYQPRHYSLVLVSALFTSFVALRQIALHVVPGTGEYGSAIFGLHLYTWSFIISMIITLVTAIILGFNRQYVSHYQLGQKKRYLTNTLFIITALIILANVVGVILECGFQVCPDNPVQYELISNTTL